ncbi:MAG TPA: hypothetical protein VHC86_03425 [Opitutaceae bacterium]|nr:hypothetical protein [Opitutaceae bacterium]
MTFRRQLPVFALLVAAVAAALAWAWRSRAEAARAARAETDARLAAAAGQEAAVRQKVAAPAPGSRPADAAPPATAFFQRLQNDPAFQNLYLAGVRARTSIRYRAFFSAQKLSPDQIRQFLDIEVKRQAAMLDLRAIEQQRGISSADPVIRQMQEQILGSYRDAQAALFGPGFSRQRSQYLRNVIYQDVLGNLAGTAALGGEPLAPAQITQLQGISSAAVAPDSNPLDTAAAWNAIMSQAGNILSPAQRELLATADFNSGGYGGLFQDKLSQLITQRADEDAAAGKDSAP